ncbi:MAG: GSCFA family protein [Rhodobacterales bacterium CG2_30_65_12]|nr:MAG: GSCFA family protein [Rhodobacterales bacterium CG2_30_65_12]
MTHPYSDLPPEAFWRTAVAAHNPLKIRGLWQPKFRILRKHRIATAGSCFAQHIGQALAGRGYNWFNAEEAPSLLPAEARAEFNYGIFSFRTGNIYTAAMLLQWLQLAYGLRDPIEEVWQQHGRFFDPLRPVIEPGGFASAEELFGSRESVLAAIRRAVEEAHVFVFTMGLTESWRNLQAGFEYALCPGTTAGTFDAETHGFHNHQMGAILDDMRKVLRIMKRRNKRLRVLLTVSPVPLTATASGQHVLTATTYSKSVLRAVAGQLVDELDFVDYFPSYEIVTHPIYRGMFFAPNQRTIVHEGVDVVMQNFFDDQTAAFGDEKPTPARKARPAAPGPGCGGVKCEEEMLGAFA